MIDTSICSRCVNFKGVEEQRKSSTRPGVLVTMTVRRCTLDGGSDVDRVRGMACPLGFFDAPDETPAAAPSASASAPVAFVPSFVVSASSTGGSRAVALPKALKPAECLPCAKTRAAREAVLVIAPAPVCDICDGDHRTVDHVPDING